MVLIGLFVEKVVITAAGLGTRLLPISKEMPKEMLQYLLEALAVLP
jgi:UTP-glucose-1-phosphate uridylyltransferase